MTSPRLARERNAAEAASSSEGQMETVRQPASVEVDRSGQAGGAREGRADPLDVAVEEPIATDESAPSTRLNRAADGAAGGTCEARGGKGAGLKGPNAEPCAAFSGCCVGHGNRRGGGGCKREVRHEGVKARDERLEPVTDGRGSQCLESVTRRRRAAAVDRAVVPLARSRYALPLEKLLEFADLAQGPDHSRESVSQQRRPPRGGHP